MFGSQILVAPLFEEGDSRNVYLPGAASWVDYQTGKTYAPGWNKISVDDDALQCVILVRDGAVIPHVKPALHTGALDFDRVERREYKAK